MATRFDTQQNSKVVKYYKQNPDVGDVGEQVRGKGGYERRVGGGAARRRFAVALFAAYVSSRSAEFFSLTSPHPPHPHPTSPHPKPQCEVTRKVRRGIFAGHQCPTSTLTRLAISLLIFSLSFLSQSWNSDTMAQNLRRMQYAVRGEVVMKAETLQQQVRNRSRSFFRTRNCHKMPYF